MKNQRIKINIRPYPIDSKSIWQMQDFGAVMKGYSAATLPFYKKWWFWGGTGVAVIGTAIIAVSAFNFKPEQPKPSEIVSATTPVQQAVQPAQNAAFIKPAFKGFDVDFTSYTITSGEAKTITVQGGTTIEIPACLFLTADGKEVNGKVEIKYREMKDPVDFAVSGIPMTYDSAGQKFVFESAGMFEIQGWKDGKQVLVNPACPITIKQKTVAKHANFNNYYLDTVARNWQFLGNANWEKEPSESIKQAYLTDTSIGASSWSETNITIVDGDTVAFSHKEGVGSKEIETKLAEIEELKKSKPQPPKTLNTAKTNFTLTADTINHPELAAFMGVTFEVDSDDKNFKPFVYNYFWKKVDISLKDSVSGLLSMKLERGDVISDGFYEQDEEALSRRDVQVKKQTWWERFVQSVRNLFIRKKTTVTSKKTKDKKENKKRNDINHVGGDSAVYDYTYNGNIRLLPLNQNAYAPLRYNLRNTNSIELLVHPILEGADYENAVEAFVVRLNEYNKLLAKKTEELEKLRKEAEAARLAAQAEWEKRMREHQEEMAKSADDQRMNYSSIRNAFSADKFGIYNSDNPVRLTNAKSVTVDFTYQGDEVNVDIAYLLVKNRNILMSNYYYKCCDNTLKFNVSDNNQLFVVLPDDYVAVLDGSDFSKFTRRNNKAALRVSSKPMRSNKELKEFLGLKNSDTQTVSIDKVSNTSK
ncbi:hypothetical protein QQ054_35390 [Oscillatoria amoena NRMC-F 0135]|nr:hypothetical protein [Oscillatoria amoena NRMC-F 0135]